MVETPIEDFYFAKNSSWYKFVRTSFVLFSLFVIAMANQIYGQANESNEHESEILKLFDFFETYGNQGRDIDEEDATIIFLHLDSEDSTRSYKSYRIEENVPEENVLEFHLKPERNNELVAKYSEIYTTYDKSERNLNQPKAIDTFMHHYDRKGSRTSNGQFRYRLDIQNQSKVFKAEQYIVGEGPDGSIIYRVETTVPKQPFEYDSMWQLPPLPAHFQLRLKVDSSALTEEAKQIVSDWDENKDQFLNFEEFDKWTTQYALDWEEDNELSRQERQTKLQEFIDVAPTEPKIPKLHQFRLPEHLAQALKASEDNKFRTKFEAEQKDKFKKFDLDGSNNLSDVELSSYITDLFNGWMKDTWSELWSDTFEWTELEAKPKTWEDVDIFEPTADEWREYRAQKRREAEVKQWSQEFTKWKKFVSKLDPLKDMESRDFIANWDVTADKELNREELEYWLDWFAEGLTMSKDANPEFFSELEIPELLLQAATVVEDDSLQEEFKKSQEQRFVQFDIDDSDTLSATELVEYLTDVFSD